MQLLSLTNITDVLPGREQQEQSELQLQAQPDVHRGSRHPMGPREYRCVTALTPQRLATEKQTAFYIQYLAWFPSFTIL